MCADDVPISELRLNFSMVPHISLTPPDMSSVFSRRDRSLLEGLLLQFDLQTDETGFQDKPAKKRYNNYFFQKTFAKI